jgi:hypothetical protein
MTDDDGTFRQHLPADQRDAHARGWTHFMARLAIAGACSARPGRVSRSYHGRTSWEQHD